MDLDGAPETGFTVAKAKKRLSAALRLVAAELSKDGFAIRSTERAAIEQARKMAHYAIDRNFDMMERVFDTRRSNLQKFADRKFVSIGADCLPRTVFTRWGLKPTSALGEKTAVFDLSVQPLSGTRRLLETDFEGFLEGIVFSEKLGYPVQDAFHTRFVHDYTPQDLENDLAGIRAKYERRILQFSKDAKEDATVFVLHTATATDRDWDDFLATRRELLRLRDGRPALFMWYQTPPFGSEITPNPAPPDDTLFLSEPYPFVGYVWHDLHHTFTEAGMRFEEKLISEAANFLGRFAPYSEAIVRSSRAIEA
jgi:hypothetical protein